MKKLLLIIMSLPILLLTGTQSSWAQAVYDGGINTQPPQVWSFMKYTHLNSTNNYTGTVFLRIPLYQYKDNDFDIPISVDYASGGYMPNIQTGPLGLGWILNAGGYVTREVRGFADDEEVAGGPISFLSPRYGYSIHHLDTNTAPPDWNDIMVYNFFNPNGTSNTFCFRPATEDSLLSETCSDIYHFRFGEHKGSFVLGPNKTVYIYDTNRPSGEYSIDVSKMKDSYKITIVTGDGYRYLFNSFKYLDYVYPDGGRNCKIPAAKYNLSWVLQTIETPNGRKVEFTYSDIKEFDLFKPIAYIQTEGSGTGTSGWFSSVHQFYSYSDESGISYAAQSGNNLTQITIDKKLKIKFVYEEKRPEESVGVSNDLIKRKKVVNLGQLKAIEIIDAGGDTLKKCTFEYNPNVASGGNPISFLKGLTINNEEKYHFSYYDELTPFPYHGTTSFDHWGYNNKSSKNEYEYKPERLIPLLDTDAQFNERVLSNQREPNVAGAIMGMLKTVVYPTDGYTEFEYEGNTYSQKVGRNFTTSGIPTLIANSVGGYTYPDLLNYPAGGVRIKSITHFDQNRAPLGQKKYYYTDNAGNSTGILHHYPRYLSGVSMIVENANYKLYQRSGTTLFPLSADRHHIGYSKVREENSDGSYVDYFYTNYADTPDQMGIGIVRAIEVDPGNPAIVTFPQYSVNFYRVPVSKHRLRGLLSRKLTYNNHDSLVQKQIYTYRHVSKFAECIETMWGYSYVQTLLVGDIHKEVEQTTSYFPDGDSMQIKKTYLYNAQGQVTEERIQNTQGRNTIKKRIFPQELAGLSWCDYITSNRYWHEMQDVNYISTPLIEMKYVDSKLTEAIRYDYATLNALEVTPYFKISSIYKAELPNLLNETDIPPFSRTGADQQVSFDHFDQYGNVIQTTTIDGLVTSYLWGYNGRHIVAKIVNMTFSEVKKALGAEKFDSNTLIAETLDETDCEVLRNKPQTLITNYTYKPYVGMISQTDPSGRKTFFEYDSIGRLITIKDGQQNKIESYKYNLKK